MADSSKRNVTFGIYAIIALLFGMTLVSIAEMFGAQPLILEGKGKRNPRSVEAIFRNIDKALEPREGLTFYQFKGDAANPFRPLGKGDPGKRRIRTAEPKCNLSLKGILEKKNPLAIIQDETGQSFILKAGEKVCEMTVVSITREKVILQGPSGKQELSIPQM